MSSPLSDTYSVAGYISQLSHISIPPLQNDDNRLPALRGGTDCLTLTIQATKKLLFLCAFTQKTSGEPSPPLIVAFFDISAVAFIS